MGLPPSDSRPAADGAQPRARVWPTALSTSGRSLGAAPPVRFQTTGTTSSPRLRRRPPAQDPKTAAQGTYAVELLLAAVSIAGLSARFGHSSVQTTER